MSCISPPVIPDPSQDDIIDDVEDFVAAAEILKERGAYKIYIMATHGLLSAEAPRLIEESAIDEVNLLLVPVHKHISDEIYINILPSLPKRRNSHSCNYL